MKRSETHLIWRRLLLAGLTLSVAAAASAAPLGDSEGPYRLELRTEGRPARTFRHAGETWILGEAGARYTIRVVNGSSRQIEAVVSVDGLDVIDGAPASPSKRGYLVPAWGSLDIDGFRISKREAAAFRFAPIEDSYAALTGRPRNIGVIGLAVFPERAAWTPWPPEVAQGEARRDGETREAESSARDGAPSAPREQGAGASGDAGPSANLERRSRSSGLGTAYGEALSSPIREVRFVRADPSRPEALLGVRYNDRRGLIAQGIDVDCDGERGEIARRQIADPFPADRRYAPPPPGWRR